MLRTSVDEMYYIFVITLYDHSQSETFQLQQNSFPCAHHVMCYKFTFSPINTTTTVDYISNMDQWKNVLISLILHISSLQS